MRNELQTPSDKIKKDDRQPDETTVGKDTAIDDKEDRKAKVTKVSEFVRERKP